jgi:hypothetical protein
MKEMRKQIDAEKKAGLIMDPMQIAQQGQQELMNPDGAGGGGGAPAPAADATPAASPTPQPKGDLSLGETVSPSLRMLGRAITNNNMSKQSLYESQQAQKKHTIIQESVSVEPEDPNVELTKSLINFIDSMSSEDNKVGPK